jgi:hypothetical protein
MRIQDFNAGGPPQAASPAPSAPPAAPPSRNDHAAQDATVDLPLVPTPAEGAEKLSCAEAKIALLQARIAHLEAVVEAARGLMTSNQERLLRRLHEMPREIAALSTRLDRLSAASSPAWYDTAGASK